MRFLRSFGTVPYSSNDDGWTTAEFIEAGVPYIISMPNNREYVDKANLAGRITFSATDVELGPDTSEAGATPWVDGTIIEGTYMPVDEPGVLSLNVGDKTSGRRPGSAFVAEATTIPFGAYLRGAEGRRAMPLFGGYNGLDIPLTTVEGLLIETPAPGAIRVSSSRERRVAIVPPRRCGGPHSPCKGRGERHGRVAHPRPIYRSRPQGIGEISYRCNLSTPRTFMRSGAFSYIDVILDDKIRYILL